MENNNLDFWNKAKTVPKDAQKKIRGGRLSGMTDINPTWRARVMTDYFGPCGIGWRFEPLKKWTEPGSDGQVMAFVDIALFVKDENGEWSSPIYGTGGSDLIAKETKGLWSDNEAWKKATTDALSTAMKMLGVAADIYMGNDDGSKYVEYNTPKVGYVTREQLDKFVKLCKTENLEPKEVAAHYAITKNMKSDKFEDVFRLIESHLDSGDLGFRHVVPENEGDVGPSVGPISE